MSDKLTEEEKDKLIILMQECVDRAHIMLNDVIPQLAKMTLQDFQNLNALGMLTEKLTTRNNTDKRF